MAGIGSCLQSFLDNNMSADSEEGKCHKVFKQYVRFTFTGALENAMTQEKNMKNLDSDFLYATACYRPVKCK